MKFRAGNLEFNANVSEANESVSPQTGDTLRQLTIQFRAQKESIHEQALEQAHARQIGGLFSLDDTDSPVLEWRVRDSSYSYVGSAPWGVNHHIWRIEQIERLECERLRIGPIELEPYEYKEEALEDGMVRLAARALISAEDLEALAATAMQGPVEVVRIGVSDTPRRMRVDYVWGERSEGPAVAVVCADVAEPRVTVAGLSRIDVFAELVSALRASGALNEEVLRQERHTARRVADIDAWTL